MRLAVVTNSEGRIYALAVCRAIFDKDPRTVTELSIQAQPLQGGDPHAVSFQTHMVELPPYLDNKTDDEVRKGLRDLQESMYLDLTEAKPCFREHGCRSKSAD